MASFGDQLVLFSKDRKTQNSAVYLIDKKAGHYDLAPKDTLDVNCLITGADYHEPSGLMAIHVASPKEIWMTSEDEGLGLPRLFKTILE